MRLRHFHCDKSFGSVGSDANNWWLRSANSDNDNNVGNVNNDGNVNNNNANNNNGLTPAARLIETKSFQGSKT